MRGISRGVASRDGSAVKSHSTILQRLRRQISLDYYTIPPAMQASFIRTGVLQIFMKWFNFLKTDNKYSDFKSFRLWPLL